MRNLGLSATDAHTTTPHWTPDICADLNSGLHHAYDLPPLPDIRSGHLPTSPLMHPHTYHPIPACHEATHVIVYTFAASCSAAYVCNSVIPTGSARAEPQSRSVQQLRSLDDGKRASRQSPVLDTVLLCLHCDLLRLLADVLPLQGTMNVSLYINAPILYFAYFGPLSRCIHTIFWTLHTVLTSMICTGVSADAATVHAEGRD